MENHDIRMYNKSVYWSKDLDSQIEELWKHRYIITASDHYFKKAEMLGVNHGTYKAVMYGDCVECETVYGVIVKVVVRLANKYDRTKDLCFPVVLNPNNETAFVRTVWINRVDDKHYTLDESKYFNPV